MQRCGCCNRYLLTGETFRLYRRRLRAATIVCAQCRLRALTRGWAPLQGPVYRQMTRRPRIMHVRAARPARAVAGPSRPLAPGASSLPVPTGADRH